MSELDPYKATIKAKHKEKSFSDFIYEVCSWYPLAMHRTDGQISIYPGNDRHARVVSNREFEEHRDALASADHIPGGDVFSEFGSLLRSISLPGFHHYYGVENSDYSNHISSTTNAYASYHVTGDCENVLYSLSTKIHSTNIYNSTMSWIYSENVYQSLGVIQSTNIYYSRYIQNSRDIWFSTDLVGCSECIGCSDLENTSYAIDNVIYPKDIYLQKKIEILRDKSIYQTRYRELKGKGNNRGSKDTTGKYCSDSEDIEGGYYSHFVKTGKNLLFTGHPDGLSDAYNSLFVSAGSGYYGACGVGGDSAEIYNCVSIMRSHECYYSYFLERCSFCFGCVGLKNREYHIYNKPYTQSDWYKKVAEICRDMQQAGTLGDFFPASLCPFYHEDSLSAVMMPGMTHDQIIARGYLSRLDTATPPVIRDDAIDATTLDTYEGYHDGVWDISPEICARTIRDATGKYYTIQPMERDFLIRHGLPLPRTYPLSRIMDNLR